MSLAWRVAAKKRSSSERLRWAQFAVEHVTDHGHGSRGAQAFHHVVHGHGASHAICLELGTEIPERQRGVGFALQGFLLKQRRRAVHDVRLRFEIDT